MTRLRALLLSLVLLVPPASALDITTCALPTFDAEPQGGAGTNRPADSGASARTIRKDPAWDGGLGLATDPAMRREPFLTPSTRHLA
jgi:hypothetical protein